jgi:hypothetical protein
MEPSPHRDRTPERSDIPGDDVYSLFFLDDHHNNNRNLKADSALPSYVGCASLAASSARQVGINLTILTNRGEELTETAQKLGVPAFNVRELDFRLELPRGIRYFQAHYKLCVLRSFGTGQLGYRPTLVDMDVFFRSSFLEKNKQHDLIAYDVSNKSAHLSHDLGIMIPSDGRRQRWWAGGEFISGLASSFATLSRKIDELLPKYIANIASFTHVGDETLVSAALNLLTDEGFEIAKAGPELGIIGRWHSSRTFIQQERFSHLWQRDILHLPADKLFLASQAVRKPSADDFLNAYLTYVRRKLLPRAILNPWLNMFTERKFLPVI